MRRVCQFRHSGREGNDRRDTLCLDAAIIPHVPIQDLSEIVAIAERAPGTDSERRTADLLRRKILSTGRTAELQAIYVHRSPEGVQALHAALGVVASVVSVYSPPAGFALLLLAIASCYLDLSSRLYLLRRLFFRRGSQNVVSPGNRPDAPERVILVAGCDVPRTGWIKGARSRELRERIPERMRGTSGIYRTLLWLGLAPLIPLLGARLAGFDPVWLTALQILPTVTLLIVAFFLVDSALASPSPGASENASGLTACLELAKRLEGDSLRGCDLWVVFTGGSTCFGEGMKAFFADDRLREAERRSTVVELQSVGAGQICYRSSQGAGVGVAPSPRLVAALPDIEAVPEPVSGDAVAASSAGIDSITLTGLDRGLPQPWRSTMADLPETVDDRVLAQAVTVAEGLVRNLDIAAMASPAESSPSRGEA